MIYNGGTAMAATVFRKIIEKLEAEYVRPQRPLTTDPLEMILLENVAYLAGDEQREKAFGALRARVGTSAKQILAAQPKALLEVARLGGMHPGRRVQKLLRIAQIAMEKFGGDLGAIMKQPEAQARKSLKLFPGIGDPGAEKILLFSGTQPILALESNGLRVLVRLGFGQESKNYAATYRSAQEAAQAQAEPNCSWMMRGHLLLRQHGQQICRRTEPACASCPLTSVCRFYRDRGRQVRFSSNIL